MKNLIRKLAVVVIGVFALAACTVLYLDYQKQNGGLTCSRSYTSQMKLDPTIVTSGSNGYVDSLQVPNRPVEFTPPAGYQNPGVPGTFSGGAVSTLVPANGAWGPGSPPDAYKYALSEASVLAKDNHISMRFQYTGQWTIDPNNPLQLKCDGGTWVAQDGNCRIMTSGRFVMWPCLHTTPLAVGDSCTKYFTSAVVLGKPQTTTNLYGFTPGSDRMLSYTIPTDQNSSGYDTFVDGSSQGSLEGGRGGLIPTEGILYPQEPYSLANASTLSNGSNLSITWEYINGTLQQTPNKSAQLRCSKGVWSPVKGNCPAVLNNTQVSLPCITSVTKTLQ